MLHVGETYVSQTGQKKQILAITGVGCYAEVSYIVTERGASRTAHKVGTKRKQSKIAFKTWALQKVED